MQIIVKIATLTNSDSATRKMYSASTLPAVVEARAGQSGRLSNIVLVARRFCTAGLWPAVRRASLVRDRKSTRLNSSHPSISYAVFCLKKKKKKNQQHIIHRSTTSKS